MDLTARLSRWLHILFLALAGLGFAACDGGDGEDNQGDQVISPPLGIVGEDYLYTRTLPVPVPVTPWTLTATRNLPAWLTAEVSNGTTLVLSGTPTTAESLAFEIDLAAAPVLYWTYRVHLEVVEEGAIDISGDWLLTVDVITVSSVCEGEQNEPPSTHTVEIAQSGNTVSLIGVQGSPQNVLTGSIHPPTAGNMLATLVLDGSVSESSGTTTMHYELAVWSTDDIDGSETWQWTGTSQSCTGTSTVTLVRVP